MTALACLSGGFVANTAAAQVCECQFGRSNERGHIAGAFGGGLFAGLVAAVLHIKHVHEASLQPSQDPIQQAAAGVAPTAGPVVETSTGSLASEPAAGPVSKAADRGRPVASHHEPRLSANEAREEGLVPPKTATMMPAYALIGAGSLLLGLFLLRQRTTRRRRWH